jgi:hypothetical protein
MHELNAPTNLAAAVTVAKLNQASTPSQTHYDLAGAKENAL